LVSQFQDETEKEQSRFQREKEAKEADILPQIYFVSSLCFYNQMHSLEEGFNFLPLVRKGKKILRIV
jgi:hypothetical protein